MYNNIGNWIVSDSHHILYWKHLYPNPLKVTYNDFYLVVTEFSIIVYIIM